MKIRVVLAGALLVAGAAFVASAEDEKGATIKDVMNKLHKGANSPLAQIRAELKSATPDWDKLQKQTKDFVILGAALAKNDPPKGDKGSWKMFADAYFQSAKALDDAAKAKDTATADAAQKRIVGSCKNCHTAHKGK